MNLIPCREQNASVRDFQHFFLTKNTSFGTKRVFVLAFLVGNAFIIYMVLYANNEEEKRHDSRGRTVRIIQPAQPDKTATLHCWDSP
jgi:hypothetical protein